MSRTAFHPQPWCEDCQAPDQACPGDHSSPIVSTPLVGGGWRDTDFGCEIPRIDVFTQWVERDEIENQIPLVYIGAISSNTVQGYLPVDLAVRIRDALTAAIGNARATLSADHHIICDCEVRR